MESRPLSKLLEEYKTQLTLINEELKKAEFKDDFQKVTVLKSMKNDLQYSIMLMAKSIRRK